MNRRVVLAGVGSVTLAGTAGCLGGLASGADDRRYEGYDRADLIPGRDAFPDGWEERPDLNEHFVVYGGPDGRVFVGLDAAVMPDADAARAAYDETRSRMPRPEDHDLADEAFWDELEGEYALTVFRHSNAIGQAFGLRQSKDGVVPDRDRSHRYADVMFGHWQDL